MILVQNWVKFMVRRDDKIREMKSRFTTANDKVLNVRSTNNRAMNMKHGFDEQIETFATARREGEREKGKKKRRLSSMKK